jgi:hypothetical protein
MATKEIDFQILNLKIIVENLEIFTKLPKNHKIEK